jgi:selenium metabolism protein YedF
MSVRAEDGRIVLVVASEVMGRGDEDLGRVLMRNHLRVLQEVEPRPDVIVFLNSGVKLATEGSPAVEDLQTLERKGATLLLCGTCLAHFELKEKVAVGEISNMHDISEALLRAAKVISL